MRSVSRDVEQLKEGMEVDVGVKFGLNAGFTTLFTLELLVRRIIA